MEDPLEDSRDLLEVESAALRALAAAARAPGCQDVRPPQGTLPATHGAHRHGWHSQDAVQIPTSLTCNLCPLYHVKRKDARHPLACSEGKKNQVCTILSALQQRWAEGLICEVQQATGTDPTPSDNARIEQIVRHRSRVFQIENYLKVAGLIDLKRGEVRNVADRLTTTENALSRTLAELRQAIADRRMQRREAAPRLEDYLQRIDAEEAQPAHDESAAEEATPCDDN